MCFFSPTKNQTQEIAKKRDAGALGSFLELQEETFWQAQQRG